MLESWCASIFTFKSEVVVGGLDIWRSSYSNANISHLNDWLSSSCSWYFRQMHWCFWRVIHGENIIMRSEVWIISTHVGHSITSPSCATYWRAESIEAIRLGYWSFFRDDIVSYYRVEKCLKSILHFTAWILSFRIYYLVLIFSLTPLSAENDILYQTLVMRAFICSRFSTLLRRFRVNKCKAYAPFMTRRQVTDKNRLFSLVKIYIHWTLTNRYFYRTIILLYAWEARGLLVLIWFDASWLIMPIASFCFAIVFSYEKLRLVSSLARLFSNKVIDLLHTI